jgi:pimeloyl-ACP methyl ester carboxylesterase
MAKQPSIHDEFVSVNGLELHIARCGTGPLMLFVHGFPQCWYEWRHHLVEFGRDYLAVAPDMRGYNMSSKPSAVEDYLVGQMVEDLASLADHYGHVPFVLVGHDMGGAVAWAFALTHPERIEHLVIIDGPHPAIWDRELRTNPISQAASRYMSLFLSPRAEEVLARDDFGIFRRWFEGVLSDEEFSVYREGWLQPGALTGMLNWYRAPAVGPPDPERGRLEGNGNYAAHLQSLVLDVPTLVVWAANDPALPLSYLDGLEHYVRDVTMVRVQGGHWVPEEQPEQLSLLIRKYLAGARTT